MSKCIEVLAKGAALKKERGFIKISLPCGTNRLIPIDDIDSLIVGDGVLLSTSLLNALYLKEANVVIVNKSYYPAILMNKLTTHYEHNERLHLQISIKDSLKKRLWQLIIKEKIKNQAKNLACYRGNDFGLMSLSKVVAIGDTQNTEARAAKIYWPHLFGAHFRRLQQSTLNDENIYLNYGYSIIRGAIARTVSSVGLHAALGLHHCNKRNPFVLIDDLMEPFRALVDWKVIQLSALEKDIKNFSKWHKEDLVGLLDEKVLSKQGVKISLRSSIQILTRSYLDSIEAQRVLLEYPTMVLP